MKTILLLTLASSLTSLAQTIQPAGVQVVWQDLKEEFDGFQTLNSQRGTKLALFVRSEKQIIGFDKSSIELKSFTDDKGSDLKGEIDFFAKTSKDNKVARFSIKGDNVPSKGATALQAKGTLKLTTASTSKTFEIKNAALKKGTELQANPDFTFSIDKAEKPKWGDAALEVAFKFKFKPSQLAKVTFKDDKGNIIPSDKNGGSSMSGFGKSTYTHNYALKQKVDTATIIVELWTDQEIKEIPFDLTVPLSQP